MGRPTPQNVGLLASSCSIFIGLLALATSQTLCRAMSLRTLARIVLGASSVFGHLTLLSLNVCRLEGYRKVYRSITHVGKFGVWARGYRRRVVETHRPGALARTLSEFSSTIFPADRLLCKAHGATQQVPTPQKFCTKSALWYIVSSIVPRPRVKPKCQAQRSSAKEAFSMSLLLSLLATNAFFHGIVVARFGIQNHNQPFFIFALVYAALAIAVYFAMPYALWAVLLLSIFGLVGLSVTFNKPVRDKTLDKIIWLLDAATILCVAYLMFAA
jgi:hypothetical protein